MPLTVLPLESRHMSGRFDMFAELVRSLGRRGMRLEQGDILAASTKYASYAEGRIVDVRGVHASAQARRLSERYGLGREMAELILRESDRVLGGTAGFVIAASSPFRPPPAEPAPAGSDTCRTARRTPGAPRRHGLLLAPNAGIDLSNARRGRAVLYPDSPYETAELLRRKILLEMGVAVGVILVDSRLMPARVGTSGVAVAHAGIEPVRDARSKPDLEGNPLKVTFQAVSDSMATVANHAMGEGAESIPFVIIRGSGVPLTSRRPGPSETAVPAGQCVYVRGLSSHAAV